MATGKRILIKPISKKVFDCITYLRILFAGLLAAYIFFFVLSFVYVSSSSMLPTLEVGTTICAKQLRADDSITRGDIVAFIPYTESNNYLNTTPETRDNNYYFIKRVIGLPGDTIAIRNNILYINGEKYEEPYLPEDLVMNDFPEITVPEGQYFMLGDNRNASDDSRVIGCIPRENILLKSIFHVDSLTSLIINK